MVFEQVGDNLLVGSRKGKGTEFVQRDPAQVAATQALRFAADPAAFVGIEGHEEVRECVLDGTEQVTDLDFDAQFLPDLAAETDLECLARQPLSARKLPEPAQEPVKRSLGDEEVLPPIPDYGGGHVAMRALAARGTDGQLALDAFNLCLAQTDERTEQAPRLAGRADGRAQIHECLVKITGLPGGQHGPGQLFQAALGVRPAGIVVHGKDAAQDALQVAVQGNGIVAEGDAGDGGCRIVPHARQQQQPLRSAGQLPAQLLDDVAGGLMEVAGASVVAHPLPGLEHPVQVRFGQGLHRGEGGQEAVVVGQDGLNARLLQHDLSDPDGVRVLGVSPGEVSPVALVPGQEQSAHEGQNLCVGAAIPCCHCAVTIPRNGGGSKFRAELGMRGRVRMMAVVLSPAAAGVWDEV